MDVRLLRERTRPEHEATEALMPMMEPGLDLTLYVRVLQVLLPVVATWEQWAGENAPEDVKTLVGARQRTHLLKADLATLGAKPEASSAERMDWAAVARGAVASSTSRTPAETEADFLGCLYVMEGSTLGGRFIARHVEETLHLAPGQGDAYFQGHGDQTGPMWREVAARISAVPDEHAERVIAAAKRTFRAFGEALRAGLPARLVHG